MSVGLENATRGRLDLLMPGSAGKTTQADNDEQQGKGADPNIGQQNAPDGDPNSEADGGEHRNFFCTTFHKSFDSNQPTFPRQA
jgi:hypothetical protein